LNLDIYSKYKLSYIDTFGNDIKVDGYSRYVLSDYNKNIMNYGKENNFTYHKMGKIFNIYPDTYSRVESSTHITIQTYSIINLFELPPVK